MVSDEALKKLQEQIMAWPMMQRFVVQQLIEDYSKVDGLREQYGVNHSSFGKTVFFTREKAEKALEAMKDA